jgi:ADP-ribosylglycohydrolase
MDQVLGMLYGIALGDALGWPAEPLTLEQIKVYFGPQGIQELPEPALFTDDTQMTLAVAEALIEAGDQDLEGLMAAVSRRFVEWLHNPESYRAPGASCLYGARQLEKGTPWREAGKPGSKGCGAAMRVAPIGYIYQDELPRLREVAAATALTTHQHPVAELGAVAAAYLVKLALDQVPPADFVRLLRDETQGLVADFDQALGCLEQALLMSDPSAALAHIGEGWVAEEAVLGALFCFLQYPRDYLAAVRLAANTSGDSDCLAALTGGFSGAYLGIQALPPAWVASIEKSVYLGDVARRLAMKKKEICGENLDK